ncbi:mandelate racemase/muconate lactonizing enzyme family protein [Occultella gossypii]|uniref:Mandelate racemase/muconate lactonizing enzyme family protein n=1 Tax=Occultella gossypii TaxID=2800820 RepID=A0ABS7SGX9_9MICO|nr:mandelate racemase/muconate lactonizing enzyme family protein [Occultella gossypii]MBZ2198985.1 mandelate racemase/muconate lactonizing enzyme family protein [Occultella gossypii]
MRITQVESIILLEQFHIVKVHTDEGLIGIGEISPMNAAVTHAIVEHALAPLLVGEDPGDIERLWRRMYTKPYKLGPMGAQLEAIAGIDIALWDLLGKAANLPVYALTGGKYRNGMKVYASSMSRSMSPQEEAERAVSFQEQGYHGYKIHSSTPWMHDDGFDQTIATVAAVRAAVGDDFPILVDVNNAYYEHTAIRIARELEAYGVWHFEEPLAAHDYAAYARLADAVDIPIAAGEQEYTSWQFRDLITQGRVDILQPDVIKCGGITEFRKIAVLADVHTKPITVHNTQQTIGTSAHAHLWVSTPSCVYPQEYNIEHNPVLDDVPIWTNPLLPVDGVITPWDLPGLGVELDEDAVARLRSN